MTSEQEGLDDAVTIDAKDETDMTQEEVFIPASAFKAEMNKLANRLDDLTNKITGLELLLTQYKESADATLMQNTFQHADGSTPSDLHRRATSKPSRTDRRPPRPTQVTTEEGKWTPMWAWFGNAPNVDRKYFPFKSPFKESEKRPGYYHCSANDADEDELRMIKTGNIPGTNYSPANTGQDGTRYDARIWYHYER